MCCVPFPLVGVLQGRAQRSCRRHEPVPPSNLGHDARRGERHQGLETASVSHLPQRSFVTLGLSYLSAHEVVGISLLPVNMSLFKALDQMLRVWKCASHSRIAKALRGHPRSPAVR